jgi:hypothetical protein
MVYCDDAEESDAIQNNCVLLVTAGKEIRCYMRL